MTPYANGDEMRAARELIPIIKTDLCNLMNDLSGKISEINRKSITRGGKSYHFN